MTLTRRSRLTASVVIGVAGAAVLALAGSPPSQAAVTGVNPVRVPVNGHPANSGFLVFVEGDMSVNGAESEGTIAVGGNFTLGSNYNVAAGAPPVFPTPTAPGDTGPIYLYVGGGINWPNAGATGYVENGGFTKIAGTGTYTAYNVDQNGAQVNYRIVPTGQPYNTTPHIDGRTHAQDPASIATPAAALLDIPAAFATYREVTQHLANCAPTVRLSNAQGQPLDLITPGSQGYLTLTPGVTNVLELSAADLANLASITFRNPPTADTPLLVNVTGTAFVGNFPNTAGIGGTQAPYILWNFATARSVTVTGGATVEGTLYAPNAALEWQTSQNIEGNVIAASFAHGGSAVQAGELHDFPFQAELTCQDTPIPSPATTTETTTTTTTTGTTTGTTVPTPSTAGTTTESGGGTVPYPTTESPAAPARTGYPGPGSPAASGPGTLASTGAGPVGWLTFGGVALAVIGTALVATEVTRRRGRRSGGHR